MNASSPTIRDVLQDPSVSLHVEAESIDQIPAYLREHGPQSHEFVVVDILAGVGAWFATGFFLVFAGMGGLLSEEGTMLGLGLVLLVLGTILSRCEIKAVFVRQLVLTMSLTGDVLVIVALAEMAEREYAAALAIGQFLICAVTYPLNKSYAFRFLAPLGVCLFAVIWMFESQQYWWFHVIVAVEALLFGILWLGHKRHEALQPLAYASACMLPGTLLAVELAQIDAWRELMDIPLWPAAFMMGLGLVWCMARLAGSRQALQSVDFRLAAVGNLLLAVVAAPGILVAVGLLAIGKALGDRYLLAFGYVFIPIFVFTYHYSLKLDLASKSWILICTGLVLLGLQQILARIARKEDLS